jgi:hypothetical protein
MRLAALAIVAASLASPLSAQVEATTPTPEEAAKIAHGKTAKPDVEMKDPMLVEAKLTRKNGTSIFADWKPNTDRNWKPTFVIWSTTETARFVCDKARLGLLSLTGGKSRKGETPVEILGRFESEWFRQDLDITMTLVDADGKVLAKQSWDDLTVGGAHGMGFGGDTRQLVLKAKIPEPAFSDFSRDGRAPTVRVLIDVQSDGED